MQLGNGPRKKVRNGVLARQSGRTPTELLLLASVPFAVAASVVGFVAWRQGGLSAVDPLLYAAAGLPVVGGIAVYLRVKKSLSEIASVVEAVRLAPDAAVSETELLVAETETGPGKAWNSLVKSRFHGEYATVSDTVTEQGHSDDSLTKLAVNSHSDAMCLVDRSGKVVLCNAAAKQFFGSDDRVVAGELIKELVEGDVYSSIEDVLSGKVQRKNSVELSRQNENNQNEAVYRFVITPINGDARAAASIVVHDVTRQRLAERSRHDFLAQATHELRTPLTNIRLYIDEAIEAGDEDPKGRAEAINVISHESQRLERIVAELLDISELEAGARVVDLGDVRIEQLLDNLKSDYVSLAESKGVSITFELPPKIPVLRGDREKIAAALHNLVGNAVKYTPSGGSVVVRAEDGEGVLRITVEDTGIGISPAEQEKVYEKFFRSDDARVSQIEGTGLGLAFAKQVAEMHGGELSLDSELNKGSTFTLAMPKPKMAA